VLVETLNPAQLTPAFTLQSLLAVSPASGKAYWRPTLAIACSPLDVGQTDIMIDTHQ